MLVDAQMDLMLGCLMLRWFRILCTLIFDGYLVDLQAIKCSVTDGQTDRQTDEHDGLSFTAEKIKKIRWKFRPPLWKFPFFLVGFPQRAELREIRVYVPAKIRFP